MASLEGEVENVKPVDPPMNGAVAAQVPVLKPHLGNGMIQRSSRSHQISLKARQKKIKAELESRWETFLVVT